MVTHITWIMSPRQVWSLPSPNILDSHYPGTLFPYFISAHLNRGYEQREKEMVKNLNKEKQTTNEMVELKLKICIYKVVKETSRQIVPFSQPSFAYPCLSSRLPIFIWDSEAKSWLNRKIQISHFLTSFGLTELPKAYI